MFTIEVELLTGRYVATSHHDRDLAEWPPHPARMFSALVAALHERDPIDQTDRAALEWLERQPSPQMDVDLSVDDEAGRRAVMDVFVPVNDVSLIGDIEAPVRAAHDALRKLEAAPATAEREQRLADAQRDFDKETKKVARALDELGRADDALSAKDLKTAVALLPESRVRQVRTFPVVCPERTVFAFAWPTDAPMPVRHALDRLCERVTRLGHSSSLVRCAVVDKAVTPTLVPAADGDFILRVVSPGQLERLETAFARHQGVELRILPSRPQRYRVNACAERVPVFAHGVFSSDWIVFERVGGARPLSSRGTDVARALRAALFEQHGSRTLPPSLSGHQEGGAPADAPHAAFVSLPFVGNAHADASIQGCAIVLPRDLPAEDRELLQRLIAGWERARGVENDTMVLGGEHIPEVRVQRVDIPTKVALRPATWCRPSRRFVTATPIALDRHPGNLRSNLESTANRAASEAKRLVGEACTRIGLPRPHAVEVSMAPLLTGAQPAQSFLPWPGRPGRHPRVRVHAMIEFADPVRGPVLIGAGRYFGLGLCIPVDGGAT